MSSYTSLEKCINDNGLRIDPKTNFIQFTKKSCKYYSQTKQKYNQPKNAPKQLSPIKA